MRIKFDIHLSWKNVLTLVGAVAVFGESLIALLVPADHLTWFQWRAAVVLIAIAGVTALIWQAIKQSREDDERERREKQRDEEIRQIKSAIEKLATRPQPPTPLASEPPKLVAATKPDTIFDGELERVFICPRIGIPYKMLQEVWKLSRRSDEPKVDCDILVAMYVVNISTSTEYIRDVAASVKAEGGRNDLERQDDFRLRFQDDFSDDMEYGFEAEDGQEPARLTPFIREFPCELPPKKPVEGWIRFILRNVAPETIDSTTWEFAIVDSRGNRHLLTKTSDQPKKGEISFRRCR